MTAPAIPEDIRARAVKLYWTAVHSDIRRDGMRAIMDALLSERTRATEAAAQIAESNNAFPEEGVHIAAEIRASIRTEGTAK